jgi:hypothetical protein
VEVVFARAALKTLDLQDIRKANRFASLAMRADELARAGDEGIEGFDFELKYLNAVTQRMLINTIDAHLVAGDSQEQKRSAARAIEQIKNRFERTSNLLRECLAWHHTYAHASFDPLFAGPFRTGVASPVHGDEPGAEAGELLCDGPRQRRTLSRNRTWRSATLHRI